MSLILGSGGIGEDEEKRDRQEEGWALCIGQKKEMEWGRADGRARIKKY